MESYSDEVLGDDDKVESVRLKHVKSSETMEIKCSGAFSNWT